MIYEKFTVCFLIKKVVLILDDKRYSKVVNSKKYTNVGELTKSVNSLMLKVH